MIEQLRWVKIMTEEQGETEKDEEQIPEPKKKKKPERVLYL